MERIIILIPLCIMLVDAQLTDEEMDFMSSGIGTDFLEDHRSDLLRRSDLPGAYRKVVDSMKEEIKTCDEGEKYPRADATCNNICQPLQGAPLHFQQRLLPNAYDNGKGSPRQYQQDGSKLPSPRLVSSKIFLPNEENDKFLDKTTTQMSMQWGQYIDHDISFTAVMHGSDCCSRIDHPDINQGGPCFPIEIPENDPYYNRSCMAFKRSFAVYDKYSVRQQISGINSYIDASTVYGSSQTQQDDLRSKNGGLLKVDAGDKLPRQGKFQCRKKLVDATHCPHAGDVRVNVFPGLTLLHLTFVREHNRLAKSLGELNPHWNDEKIFQEARRIVIALHQIIAFQEYLPHVIGPSAIEHFGLQNDVYEYKETINADVLNAFTTAAFRYGHSQINKFLTVDRKDTPISEIFFQPWKATSSETQIVEMMSSQYTDRAQQSDNYISDQVTNLLFLDVDAPGHSTDLAARNIQRGRDHGLQPFKKYQQQALQQLKLQTKKWPMRQDCNFLDVYASLDDVDLFVGGLCETPLDNALVGPTFAYIIGEQFGRLKFGDRFFFESNHPSTGFLEDQLRELRKMSLAGTICRNTEAERIQPDVFHVPSEKNKVKACNEYEEIDLSPWKEADEVLS